MAGRRPLPTSTKILAGNPGKHPLNRNEPRFGGVPSCPKHLSKVAKAEWKRVSAELIAQGLLTTVDRAALEAYCAVYARWVEAEENLNLKPKPKPGEDGTKPKSLLVIATKSGYPMPNPFIGVANTALDQMRKFLIEFGMTPAARSRISVTDAPPASTDPGDEYMRAAGVTDIDVTTCADDTPQTIRATIQ